MNNIVAKELSDAMAKCKQRGVDEPSLRTGLLTITIANFVHRLGMANTVSLFEALPGQITSGIFDQYIDPNTNTRPLAPPHMAPQHSPYSQHQNLQPQPTGTGYQHQALPQNFIPPHQSQYQGYPQATEPSHNIQGRRRLPD